jgi:Ca-activated chloride channel family protein
MMRRLRVGLAAAALFMWPAAAADGATGSETMVILDASGSMWGIAGGQTKIASARTAVRSLLEAWPTDRKLGLMAYGHRRKGDCSDIETIAPVGGIDAAALAGAVDRLNPKGKTPIAASLTKAAEDLKSNETRATIILVSDGIETCGGDPCAVAKALEESGVDFTAHVIGFDVSDPAAKAQLRCIADVSGGIYRDAEDGAGLGDALKETANAKGGDGARKPVEPAAPVEDTTLNLRGVMRLSPESDPLVGYSTAMGWRVFSDTPERESLEIKVGAAMSVQMDPRKVIVEAEYGNAKAETSATVEAGKITTVDLSLNAGMVVSEASQAGIPGSAAKNWGDLIWKVYKASDRENEVTYSFDAVPLFVLPAGSYVLTVMKDELAKGEQAFDVAAGDEINVGLQLKAGLLDFKAPDSYLVQILDARTREALGSFDEREDVKALNPGDYILKVIYMEGEIERPFTIVEGETVTLVVTR